MTVSKAESRKKSYTQKFHLSGSQINLSPRPIPATHISWSSSFSSYAYPIRRSMSAFGFQQQQRTEDDDHCLNNNNNNNNKGSGGGNGGNGDDRGGSSGKGKSRPLSADNIRYMRRQNFAQDYHNEIILSSRSQSKDEDFAERCSISENVYENILNGYSECNHCCEKTNDDNNLKPGLSSKPPLPPFADSVNYQHQQQHSLNINSEAQAHAENLVEREETLKSLAETEAFDEIIALKFQRWFPNAACYSHIEGSGSEDCGGDANGGETDDADVELLSFKRRNYKTYEYKYEMLRKNSNAKTKAKATSRSQDTTKTMAGKCEKGARKSSAKKTLPLKSKITWSSSPQTAVNDSSDCAKNVRTDDIHVESKPNDAYAKDDNELQSSRAANNDIVEKRNGQHSLGATEENLKIDKNKPTTTMTTTIPAIVEPNLKPAASLHKISSFKKSNVSSPFASPSKKQKKISFSIDDSPSNKKTEQTGVDNDDFVETYFATKNSLMTTTTKTTDDEYEKSSGHELSAENALKKSRDATSSPQQPVGSQIDDVLSWMCTHRSVHLQPDASSCKTELASSQVDTNNSMYKEMMDILKDIENEEITKGADSKENEVATRSTSSSPANAIWSLIEQAEKTNDAIGSLQLSDETVYHQPRNPDISSSDRRQQSNSQNTNWNRLSDLLRLSSTDLAQKVMCMQLLLDDRETALRNFSTRLATIEQTHREQMQQHEYSIQKQLKLIEQLKIEKKCISEKMQNTVNDLERKHAAALIALDEKHKIELKKSLEKQAAADKLERDKWIEAKTQKIKELTMKGLEPELNRMTAAHQKEIAELHKFYKEKAQDAEEVTNRRMAVQKEKLEAEKDKALAVERELSRRKLADEIGELEKRYQEQRKRLLAEVHVERENIERQSEATLAIREKENERKWETKSVEMQRKIEALRNQHQEEIKKLQQNFENEKQIWMKNQIIELSDRESKIREQCRKERDKHIELIVQKLENENTEREMASEQKIKKMKDKYEAEIGDLEAVVENLKRKFNESRNEIEKSEDIALQLKAQLTQSQTEYVILKEKYDRLIAEQGEMQNVAKSELTTKVHILQSELSQAQLTYESQMKMLKSENDRELSQMYSKVKQMIDKKDHVIKTLNKQKDAALKQCNQLEELLQLKRNDLV